MRKPIAVLLAVSMLLGVVLTGCEESPDRQLEKALSGYSKMLEDPLPEDITLTIYYMSPDIYTFHPLSAEDLIESVEKTKNPSSEKKIVIEYDVLSTHVDLLKKLNASVLQPYEEEPYMNARLYYVIETGDSGKLLEVVGNQFSGPAFVNGVPVVQDSVIFEVVAPFLTEEDRNTLSAGGYYSPEGQADG